MFFHLKSLNYFSFSLFFVLHLAFCGDGLINGTETCDDGVSVHTPTTCSGGGSGCTDACQIEAGFSCIYNTTLARSVCSRISSIERSEKFLLTYSAICGDGYTVPPETCDTNGTLSIGCTGCRVTDGWKCVGTPSECNAICGDGWTISGQEQCDDGLGRDTRPHPAGSTLYGCTDFCTIITGWSCVNDFTSAATGSVCTRMYF